MECFCESGFVNLDVYLREQLKGKSGVVVQAAGSSVSVLLFLFFVLTSWLMFNCKEYLLQMKSLVRKKMFFMSISCQERKQTNGQCTPLNVGKTDDTTRTGFAQQILRAWKANKQHCPAPQCSSVLIQDCSEFLRGSKHLFKGCIVFLKLNWK